MFFLVAPFLFQFFFYFLSEGSRRSLLLAHSYLDVLREIGSLLFLAPLLRLMRSSRTPAASNLSSQHRIPSTPAISSILSPFLLSRSTIRIPNNSLGYPICTHFWASPFLGASGPSRCSKQSLWKTLLKNASEFKNHSWPRPICLPIIGASLCS